MDICEIEIFTLQMRSFACLSFVADVRCSSHFKHTKPNTNMTLARNDFHSFEIVNRTCHGFVLHLFGTYVGRWRQKTDCFEVNTMGYFELRNYYYIYLVCKSVICPFTWRTPNVCNSLTESFNRNPLQ